ncbi:MAG: caspase domain-containing protein [Chitinophagales bacterium]
MRAMILSLLTCFCISAAAQKKMALIVAIGNYLPNSDIPSISSLNDIKYIKAVLHNNRFVEKDIDTLKDSKATKAAILNALDTLSKKAKQGDIVLIHFSCHGQQIRDQKTVEEGKDEEDGYDEALIPYDVKKPQYYPGVYKGENHLRDDDLGPKLISIRNKLGKTGSLLVLLDACFSGTATRAMEFTQSRGVPYPFNDPENPLEDKIDLPSEDHFFDNLSDSASNMVVISGSGPHQQNFQTEVTINGKKEQVGALTYAFYKAMNDLPQQSDYELLFQKIKAQIQSQHPEQIPLIEGNVSQVVFSGNYKPRKETIFLTTAADEHSSGDSVFKINEGVMDGIMEGTTLKIYSPENPVAVAEGIIKRSDRFEAFGISNKLLDNGVAYEARPDEISYGNISACIKIKTGKNDAHSLLIESQVKQFFRPYQFISLGDTADMMLDLSKGNEAILLDAIDSTRWEKTIGNEDSLTAEDKKNLLSAIKNSMRVKYLRTMPDGGDLSNYITVQIIPVKPYNVKNELKLETSEDYSLKIVSSDDEKLFYAVLDITPDNKISILYPSETKQPADYIIDKKGTVIRSLRVSRNTPMGREFLKIIVSKEPMDLRSVFHHTVQRSEMRSFQSALDDIFNDASDEHATRGDINNIKAEEVGIVTVSFTIK